MKKVLVAGLGNVFCCDDAFGVSVVEKLAGQEWPGGVEVRDFGIRGIHLAYQLLEPYDLVVLIDAVHRDGPPGTLVRRSRPSLRRSPVRTSAWMRTISRLTLCSRLFRDLVGPWER